MSTEEKAFLAGYKAGTLDFANTTQKALKLETAYVYDLLDEAMAQVRFNKWLSKTKT